MTCRSIGPVVVALEAERLAAVAMRARALLSLGRHRELVPWLEPLVEQHPLNEELRGHLMLALHRSDRQADALDGLSPTAGRSRPTRPVSIPVRTCSGCRPRSSPTTRPCGSRTSSCGRAGTCPRRSRHWSAGWRRSPPSPICCGTRSTDCSPSPGRAASARPGSASPSPTASPPITPTACGSSPWTRCTTTGWWQGRSPTCSRSRLPAGDVLPALKAHLRDLRLLLVLDNFEQVEDAAPVVSELLAAAPGLRVLVTSRIRLRLYGERVVPLEPLAPTDAVPLFVERARSVDRRCSRRRPTPSAMLCEQLDGIPLAIELVAARADEVLARGAPGAARQPAGARPRVRRPAGPQLPPAHPAGRDRVERGSAARRAGRSVRALSPSSTAASPPRRQPKSLV